MPRTNYIDIMEKNHMEIPWHDYTNADSNALIANADLIEKALFPCPRGAKSAPSPALRQRMGRSCFFTLYFLRSPISFFSSLKKLSTSANC